MILTEKCSASGKSPHFSPLVPSSFCTFIALNCPVEITYLVLSSPFRVFLLRGGGCQNSHETGIRRGRRLSSRQRQFNGSDRV